MLFIFSHEIKNILCNGRQDIVKWRQALITLLKLLDKQIKIPVYFWIRNSYHKVLGSVLRPLITHLSNKGEGLMTVSPSDKRMLLNKELLSQSRTNVKLFREQSQQISLLLLAREFFSFGLSSKMTYATNQHLGLYFSIFLYKLIPCLYIQHCFPPLKCLWKHNPPKSFSTRANPSPNDEVGDIYFQFSLFFLLSSLAS